MNKDLQVGQRVRLSPDHRWTHRLKTNPLDCEGTVNEIGASTWVGVKWDNGKWNQYRPQDSDLIPLD